MLVLNFWEHFMSQWVSFRCYRSVHIRCRPSFKNNFFSYDSFNQNSFGVVMLINNSFSDNLLCCEFNLFPNKIHDSDLKFILSFRCFFQLTQMHHTFLFTLLIISISFEFSFKLKDTVFVLFIIWFPLELYFVHWNRF